jgi:hypothetical protein
MRRPTTAAGRIRSISAPMGLRSIVSPMGEPSPAAFYASSYPSHEHYVNASAGAAAELQKERLLLAEDVERYLVAAAAAP